MPQTIAMLYRFRVTKKMVTYIIHDK